MAGPRLASVLDYTSLTRGRHELRYAVAPLPDGSELTIPLTVLQGRKARPRLVAIAGVHGDEFPGPLALADLAGRLEPGELEGTVVLVPVANPLAFNAGSRVSPEDGVNLNRVFPGRADGSLTDRLARALVEGIVQDADLAIDLHSAEPTGLMMPMAGFRERSDRVAGASARAAAAMGLEMFWMMRWAPGTLSTALNERGVPAVGCELGGGGVASDDEVALYRRGVLRCLGLLGIHGSAIEPEVPAEVEVMDDLAAPASGLLDLAVGLRDPVQQGDLLARVLDPWGHAIAELRAPRAGRVVHQRVFRQVRVGETVVSIGRKEANPAR
ncbi:MAG TPA: succinylglutamate desuccinylase/aspartoacylase family protein [Chloroflexota bacterium]|jgi:predicted deacylase